MSALALSALVGACAVGTEGAEVVPVEPNLATAPEPSEPPPGSDIDLGAGGREDAGRDATARDSAAPDGASADARASSDAADATADSTAVEAGADAQGGSDASDSAVAEGGSDAGGSPDAGSDAAPPINYECDVLLYYGDYLMALLDPPNAHRVCSAMPSVCGPTQCCYNRDICLQR